MTKKVIPAKTKTARAVNPKTPSATTAVSRKKAALTKESSNRKLIDAMYATAGTISESIVTKDDCQF